MDGFGADSGGFQSYFQRSKTYEGENRDRLTDEWLKAFLPENQTETTCVTGLYLEPAFAVCKGLDVGTFYADFHSGERFEVGIGDGSADLCEGRPGNEGQAKKKKMDFFHDAVSVMPDYRGAQRRTLVVLPSQALP